MRTRPSLQKTVANGPSRIPRLSAGLLLALIGLMMGFIAPGYCQDRLVSAVDTTALTALPTWTPTGDLNTPRFGHTATLLPSGKVLVAGGWRIDVGERQKSAELYDITTGAWSFTGSLNSARAGHTATLLKNGKVLSWGLRGFMFPSYTTWFRDMEPTAPPATPTPLRCFQTARS
jgi:hypothetical protein